MRPKPNRFKAQFRGRDVAEYKLPRSGARYDESLEWILAAVWAGYTPDAFSETLPVEWQNRVIAAYRVQMQMDGIIAREQAREARKKRGT